MNKLLLPCLLSLSVCSSAAAAEITVRQNNILVTDSSGTEGKSAYSYLYEDSNYFRLRDIGNIAGFDVMWNEQTGNINIYKGRSTEATAEPCKIPDNICFSDQKLLLDDWTEGSFTCLNVDGYNYFKLRDLAEFLGFGVEWDEKTDTIIIEVSDEKLSEKPMSDVFKATYINGGNQEVTDGMNIAYTAGSGDFSEIEKYIKENIAPAFKADDYIAEEFDGVYPSVNVLYMLFSVNNYPTKNFGYRIICENGYVKVINSMGEINPAFDMAAVPTNLISDEEAKQRAIMGMDKKYSIGEQTINRYFDMDKLKMVCEVNTEFIEKNGSSFVKSGLYYD